MVTGRTLRSGAGCSQSRYDARPSAAARSRSPARTNVALDVLTTPFGKHVREQHSEALEEVKSDASLSIAERWKILQREHAYSSFEELELPSG